MAVRDYFAGGKHLVRIYVTERGDSPIEDFLASMQESERKKMVALIEYSANAGPPRNREKCHQVEGYRFFEFKTHGHRIFWRWGRDGAIVLMHGFTKGRNRTPRSDIEAGLRRYEQLEGEV